MVRARQHGARMCGSCDFTRAWPEHSRSCLGLLTRESSCNWRRFVGKFVGQNLVPTFLRPLVPKIGRTRNQQLARSATKCDGIPQMPCPLERVTKPVFAMAFSTAPRSGIRASFLGSLMLLQLLGAKPGASFVH